MNKILTPIFIANDLTEIYQARGFLICYYTVWYDIYIFALDKCISIIFIKVYLE